MKNPLPFLLLLAAVALIAGCSLATTTVPGTTSGSVTATVNGKAWTTVGVPGLQSARAIRTSSGVVTVTGIATDGTEITLVLNNPHVGTMNLGVTLQGVSSDLGEYSQGIPDTSTAYVSIPTLNNPSPGTITVSMFDTVNAEISGSFSFIARKTKDFSDSLTITNGAATKVDWSK